MIALCIVAWQFLKIWPRQLMIVQTHEKWFLREACKLLLSCFPPHNRKFVARKIILKLILDTLPSGGHPQFPGRSWERVTVHCRGHGLGITNTKRAITDTEFTDAIQGPRPWSNGSVFKSRSGEWLGFSTEDWNTTVGVEGRSGMGDGEAEVMSQRGSNWWCLMLLMFMDVPFCKFTK